MKILQTTILLTGLAIAGCGGAKTSDSSPNMPKASPAADSAGVPCAQEVAKVCGDGRVDGCLAGSTTVHVCVPSSEKAGPPCAQEIAKVCPEGQVDACLQTPAASMNHICILK